MAVSVCLALAFTPLMADRNDRTADRTKASQRGATSDDSVARHPAIRAHRLEVRDVEDISSASRATGHIVAASKLEGDAAISELMAAVNTGVTDEKVLAEAYERLGDLYAGTASKQVHFYAMAMQYNAEPEARAQLQSRIAALGGDLLALSVRPSNNVTSLSRGPGDDTCDVSVPITLPWLENMDITPAGDHNWRSFDIPGPEFWGVRIETISPNPPYFDDTDLTLWAECVGSVPQGQIAFNDDGGEGFMSLIETGCMAPGTYYIEVGGYFNVTPVPDFDLAVEVIEICVPADPDGWEPDDERVDANAIGKPSSLPAHANGWGRAKDEIQAHSIAPPLDIDNMKFSLAPGPERVDMRIAYQFPTKWNDLEYIEGDTDLDSFIELLYGNEPSYGGFCNDQDNGYAFFCRSDDDCPPSVDPVPGLPACIPIYFFPNYSPPFYPENPLMYNYDIAAGNWASAINICLPITGANSPMREKNSGFWGVRVYADPYDPFGDFEYELQVKNLYKCTFEQEPNGGFDIATPLTLGETMSGIQELSAAFGGDGSDPTAWAFNDTDMFSFDVDEEKLINFRTASTHPYESDTYLEIYVGPDDAGLYYFTGLADDDGGGYFLSQIESIFPPASDLLGNEFADADYYINCTTVWLNDNFPWDLISTVSEPPVVEAEPNDTCETGNAVDGPVLADINPACDYDAFTFTLTEDTYVVLGTGGSSGDTVMKLEGATIGGGTQVCDDDSGDGLFSQIEGCLPPGDYCVTVRAYSDYSVIGGYTLNPMMTGACVANDPPALVYDDGLGCPIDDLCP